MIEVEGLTKYYGERAAVRDLKFHIKAGEVIGFLGLNGAGKTTTLKILGCVLLPTAGRVRIDGFDVVADPHEVRKRIGFLPDTPPLYGEMTVGDYLTFVARLRGVTAKDAAARVAEAEEKTHIADKHDDVISSLSHGYRQRVGLAQAIVHRPSLLILDEPTSGLDPAQIVEMRSLIKGLRGEHTVLLSSHILSEVSQTCDRLLVIEDGAIVAQGTEAELARSMGGVGFVDVEVRGDGAKAVNALAPVEGIGAIKIFHEADGVAQLRVEAPSDLRPAIVRALVNANVDVLRIDRASSELESIFLRLTRDHHGGQA